MKRIAAILSALLVGAAGASAADLPVKAPPPIAAFNWTGFYIGGFVGGAFSTDNATSTDPISAAGGFYNGGSRVNSYGASGFMAGGTAGYNYQPVGSNWVFGIEGEGGYLHAQRTVQDINAVANGLALPDSLDTTKIGDGYGVVAGRLGFATDNHLLLYGKAGVAFVNKSYSFADNCVIGGCGGGILNLAHSETQVTWAAGAGFEYAVTNNWSIKGEYLYLATQEQFTALSGGPNNTGTTYTNVHTDPGLHTLKAGINYRFGGPVVANY
jgi:outer membrane immunogenic protein